MSRRRQLAVWLFWACLLPGLAWAGTLGSITLPEGIDPFAAPVADGSLFDPQPVNGSWAVPDARPLGVNIGDYNLTAKQLSAARSSGCQLIRIRIPMERFISEANPDWAVLDQVVSRLDRAGFEILPVLDAEAAVPQFYEQFCAQVAQRYGSTFHYYQLLDDINYKIGLESQAYVNLVSLARTAIILADADAKIVCGGVRGVDLTYLEILRDQGVLRCVDVSAFNLYPPTDGIDNRNASSRREHCLPFMQDAINWASAAGKPVWVTSLGVSTCYNWVGVDQPDQASMYTRGALYLGWFGVERVIFAAIQDSDPSYHDPQRCCGLLDVTGAPKASFTALQGLSRVVFGAYHVAVPFRFEGTRYEKPSAATMSVSPRVDVVETGNEYEEFLLHDVPVYGFWFYAPGPREYRYVYWVGTQQRFDLLMSMHIESDGLKPIDRYILLDDAPSAVNYRLSINGLYLPYVPLDETPGVIRFEVKEHGRAG